MISSAEKTKKILPYLHRASLTIMGKLKADHILLSHVVGDEKSWESGKEVELITCLVNYKTGKLRYFATVKAKKGAIPIPFMAQLGNMSSSIFDAALEKDTLKTKT